MTDSLGFLLSDVSRLMRRRFDERARQVGATRAQWRTLVTLSRNEGLNQGALADLLEVEPITLCRMVDRLVSRGLVSKESDTGDGRGTFVCLTDDGYLLFRKVAVAHAESINRHVGGALSTEELRELGTLTTKLRASVERD